MGLGYVMSGLEDKPVLSLPNYQCIFTVVLRVKIIGACFDRKCY